MKKVILVLLFSFSLFTVKSCYALVESEDGMSPTIKPTYPPVVKTQLKLEEQQRLKDIKEKYLQERNEIQERIRINQGENENRLQEEKKERVRNYFSNMYERLNALIERLNKIIIRIEMRITQLESETGKDLSFLNEDLDDAKTLLNETQAKLDASDSSIEDVLSSSNPHDAFKVLKENLSEIKTNLIEVKKILSSVISKIIGLHWGQNKLSPTVTL